jgi:hypothetical protein
VVAAREIAARLPGGGAEVGSAAAAGTGCDARALADELVACKGVRTVKLAINAAISAAIVHMFEST